MDLSRERGEDFQLVLTRYGLERLLFPAPQLNAYPRETVVAEKFQAMVQLGMANSRMKDFYDVWTLARQFEFDGTGLCAALPVTFQRRQTLPRLGRLARALFGKVTVSEGATKESSK